MKLLKTAHYLTIVNCVVIMPVIIMFMVYYFTHFVHTDLGYIIACACVLVTIVSWIMNVIAAYQNIRLKWIYWMNTILTILAGYYFIVYTCTFVWAKPPKVDMFFAWRHPLVGEFLETNYAVINGIFLIFLVAWAVQYIINSVYVMTCYKHMKHYLYPPKEEVSDAQRARYEAVRDEVNARAERMACKDFGIPEGGYEFGMCHRVWKYKKEILKTEYGIDWHSPAELNPQTCFD